MFPAALLVAFATATYASPVVIRDNLVSLRFSKTVNITSAQHLIKSDRARVQHLLSRTSAKKLSKAPQADDIVNVPVVNQAVSYTANVGVGSPATTYSLIVDTGSSNTWVGATTPYRETSTSNFTGDLVEVIYGSGAFLGDEFTDTVTISPGLVITGQSIGAAIESEGFNGVDGIIGIGPVDLTAGTLFPDESALIPTVTDNLFSQGTIPKALVAVSFEPTTVLEVENGELTFGGTDSSKFTGDITFTPLTTVSPASEFWGIDQDLSYGSQTLITGSSGIVDTGTTLLLLATDVFDAYQSATGAVIDNNVGLLSVTPAQFANLQSLFFTIGGTVFEFTPNAQLWPRALNTAIGGTNDDIFLIVGDVGNPSGEGLDFIDGQVFLERFYSVFDTTNSQVGFATTPFTNATTN